jgi:SAM-dependent methyltransferase
MKEIEYTFTRYLSAKKTVDDRALNRVVWQSMAELLPKRTAENPLRVLEVGSGIGTMPERMLDWGLFDHVHYTALDEQPENTAVARRRLALRNQANAAFDLETGDIFEFVPRKREQSTWDLLAANAFLDLVDIPMTLPLLFSLLQPGGFFYFSLNFDGVTLFEPEIDRGFDDHIQALYHRTMDDRIIQGKLSGDSRSGRHLFHLLAAAGAETLASGASDWVVFPLNRSYPYDEAYFLHFIIHTVQQALARHAEIEPRRFQDWVATRHAQIERGELVYVAHQIDFFGRLAGYR